MEWHFVQRRSLPELRAEEAVELADAQPVQPIPVKSEAEKAQALLNDSRFTDKP